MYIIDESYFNGKVNIPNLNAPNTDINEEVNDYITDKVRLFLMDCLGVKLFRELDEHLVDGELQDSAPKKWKDFVNGCYYEYEGKEYYYPGLIQQEQALKKSILAYFVFYHWLTDNVSKQAGIGEVVTNGKNAINVNSTQRLIGVWNDFVKMNNGDVNHSPDVYRKGCTTVIDWSPSTHNEQSSVLTFLNHHEADFKGHNNKVYRIKNQYGFV